MNYPFTPQPLLIVQEQFKNFRNIHVTITANPAQKGITNAPTILQQMSLLGTHLFIYMFKV
jgi:hypothetical protein